MQALHAAMGWRVRGIFVMRDLLAEHRSFSFNCKVLPGLEMITRYVASFPCALIVATVMAVFFANQAWAQVFSQVIVFGDSNEDSGYYRALPNPGGSATYNAYWPAAVAAGAGAPTSRPGLISSEHLASYFGITLLPANQPGGTNYATSGAKNVTVNSAATGGFRRAIPTVTQISNYLVAAGAANPTALYRLCGW
jgi:outer membrane lipase/esterase